MHESHFHKGDQVSFQLGARLVRGVVKEDRGPIGVKGRHLYLIEFRIEPGAPILSQVELPAVHLQPVAELTSRN